MPAIAAKRDNPTRKRYAMTLYVTGANRTSQRAVANLNAICEQYMQGDYDLEVIDIYRFPSSAVEANIIAAPTLVKKLPEPMRRVIGDLSQKDRVLLLLDLKKK